MSYLNPFMPDGKTPRCPYCDNGMNNWTSKRGKFKGQLQLHSWYCDCEGYPESMVLSCG